MSFWNHTTQTGLFQGRGGGQNSPYQEGDAGIPVLPRNAAEATTGFGLYVDNIRPGQEALGLYPGTEVDPSPPADFYQRADPAYAFALIGPEFQAGTIVQRTSLWQSLSIDDIYTAQIELIGSQDQRVRYNAVDTQLSANWWIITTQTARFEILGIASASNTRQLNGQPWPGGANAPYLGIYRQDTGKVRRVQVTSQATWDTIEQEIVQHDQQCGTATDASREALDTAYNDGAGDIEAVRAHDPTDPQWNYPPVVELNGTAQSLFG